MAETKKAQAAGRKAATPKAASKTPAPAAVTDAPAPPAQVTAPKRAARPEVVVPVEGVTRLKAWPKPISRE